ncbi:hypothetical protein D3C72_1769530 [compost metagenome]
MFGEVPAMVRGGLARIVRHQRHLLRLARLAQRQEVLRRIALDIELGLRERVVDQSPEHGQVGEADMPLVRPRMDRQATGAGLERDAAEMGDIRPRQIAAVAQHGNGIEVYGELRGHSAVSMKGRLIPISFKLSRKGRPTRITHDPIDDTDGCAQQPP